MQEFASILSTFSVSGCPIIPTNTIASTKLVEDSVLGTNGNVIAPYTGQIVNFNESLRYICHDKGKFIADFNKVEEIVPCSSSGSNFGWGTSSFNSPICTPSRININCLISDRFQRVFICSKSLSQSSTTRQFVSHRP